jgi:mRNA-degrading endonuclease toxin of MazEF toxin-antitoxin module
MISGEIVIDYAQLNTHLIQGRRPVLVVSVNALQTFLGLAMVCAITTHGGRSERARNDLEVPIPPGLPVKGVVLPHQMRTIDCKARHSEKLCTVPRATLQAARSRLKVLLSL